MRQKSSKKIFSNEWEYIVLLIPAIAFFIIFSYLPMSGLILSFKDMQPGLSILESPWVGFKWFREFFQSPYFWRSLKNTFLLAINVQIFEFPFAIILALALNEIKKAKFKRLIQSVSSFPHFISTVIVVTILFNFIGVDHGIVNGIIRFLGKEPINFLNSTSWYMPLYIITDIWKEIGWSSIIYLAALTAIDPTHYEAAKIDGANRWKQIKYISFPSLMPTIVILFLLSVGNMLNIGFEKVLLMYNPAIYDVADIISTYVYRSGVLSAQYSYGTAVGFFNQILNFILLISANSLAKKFSGESLW